MRQSTNETMAPRAGLPGMNSANGLDCQTYSRSSFDPQRFSGAVANQRAPGVRAIDQVQLTLGGLEGEPCDQLEL